MITVLIMIIRACRLVPCRIRRTWSMGASTSHLALGRLADPALTSPGALVLVTRMAIPLSWGWMDYPGMRADRTFKHPITWWDPDEG